MGDKTWWFEDCPKCGKELEVFDAPSSLMWSSHCDHCGYDDGRNYYEDKDGYTVHLLTEPEARKIAPQLYAFDDEQVNGLVSPGSETNTDSSNSPTEATQERKEAFNE